MNLTDRFNFTGGLFQNWPDPQESAEPVSFRRLNADYRFRTLMLEIANHARYPG